MTIRRPPSSRPAASRPAASRPVASRPVASRPVASRPVASRPVATRPLTIGATHSARVLDDLRRIVRVLRESSREAEQRLGVTGAQLFVMQTLAEQQSLSLNELAARTRTHQSTVSVVVKRLVEHGLLTRATSATDARRISLSLTKRGRALLQQAPLAAQDRLIQGLERMPLTRRTALARGLASWVAAMQLEGELPAMFFEEEEPTSPKQRGARRVAP